MRPASASKRIFLISTFAIMVLLASLGGLAEAQHSVSALSYQDLNATIQKFSGTLTAIAPLIHITPVAPRPRSTIAPIVPLKETIEVNLPEISPYSQNESGSSGSQNGRYIILRPDKLIDIDGLVAFTLTLSAIWVGILLVLSLAGTILNRLLLNGILQSALESTFHVRPTESLIRWLYGVVIGALSLYFFLSIPILVLVIAALVLTINRVVSLTVPSIIILGISGYGSYYILRAIWLGLQTLAHTPETSLRLSLSRSQSTSFWQLNQEVAERINTRPIQTVYLIPDAQIAVKEAGNFIARIRDRNERFLDLGVGAIDQLSQTQLKAILAHEYSHLRYRDVGLGRGVTFRVRRAILDMMLGLKEKGYGHWFNPVWLLLILFGRAFFRITFAAMRYQELWADRQAAQLYGAATYVSALLQLVHNGVVFDMSVRREFQQALEAKRALHNLYQLPELDEAEQAQVQEMVHAIINRPTHTFDMHPSLGVRIALITGGSSPMSHDEASGKPAWELFSEPETIQYQMTGIVQKNFNLYRFYGERMPTLDESEILTEKA